MDIQFHHHNKNHYPKRTVAVSLPTASDFAAGLENEKREIVLSTGIAHCSTKDQYRKATGREISLSRMIPVNYRLTSMDFSETGDVYFQLISPDGYLSVKMNVKSPRLHLLEAF